MSVERSVPPARQTLWSRLAHGWIVSCGIAAVGMLPACSKQPPAQIVVTRAAPDGAHVAFVRLIPCGPAWCESLWIGADVDSATRIATLPAGQERCDEIAWTRDGKRVAFLVNGYQLRLYDAHSHAPAGLVDLVPADAKPTTRIARGVTFSDNAAAITFDDCPRDRSGCRPGIQGLR